MVAEPPPVRAEDAAPAAEVEDTVEEPPVEAPAVVSTMPDVPAEVFAQPRTAAVPERPLVRNGAAEPDAAVPKRPLVHNGEPAAPAVPELMEGVPVTGELLRQVREARSITLEQISDTTKIAIYYLRCIETETFEDLPAPVYVRGYLRQIAMILGLDANLVVDGYIERMATPGEPLPAG